MTMIARTSLIAALGIACALLTTPAHADCQPGQTDLGVACVSKPVIAGPDYGNLPGVWQVTPKDAASFYRTNTATGQVDQCFLAPAVAYPSTAVCHIIVEAGTNDGR